MTHACRGRTLRLVLGFSPGSASDIIAHALVPALGDALGATIAIERHLGANGTDAAAMVAASPPDGNTLFVATLGTHALAPHLGRVAYDPRTSFAPVALVAAAPLVLAVHPSLALETLPALVALARSAPRRLTFATSAVGGAPHLAGELFQALAGVELVHVRYDRTQDLYADLEAGKVAMSFNNVMSMAPRVTSGKLRGLAVTAAERSPVLPDLPTMAEAGIADYAVTNWLGIVAPAGTAPEQVDELNRGVEAALRSPAVVAALAKDGVVPAGGSPAAFARHIAQELERWGPVVARFRES
jgi:tripartite-type tricarboxylate transporter receptor subunit TctC